MRMSSDAAQERVVADMSRQITEQGQQLQHMLVQREEREQKLGQMLQEIVAGWERHREAEAT